MVHVRHVTRLVFATGALLCGIAIAAPLVNSVPFATRSVGSCAENFIARPPRRQGPPYGLDPAGAVGFTASSRFHMGNLQTYPK